jgi:hypothetical protein
MNTIENPYAELTDGMWLKGNLHTHTTKSDGARPPQAVIDDYAERRYDFLMISDHDVFTSSEDLSCYDARGMVLIPGNEITANGPHVLHVNASRLIAPCPQRQTVINEATGDDPKSFVIANHPNWQSVFDHATLNQLEEWVGYTGLEIYNGTIGRLDGSPYATNKWDILLSRGRRLWGYANDDSHLPVADVGLGWNVVYARTRTLSDVVGALRQGRFYASTGVVIRDLRVEGTTVHLETENAERIVALREVGKRFAQTDSSAIEIQVPPEAKYVRFECWGKGESFAWTQPLFVAS